MASAKGARRAAIWGTQQLQQNEPRILGELDKGFDYAKGQYGAADTYYQPYAEQYGRGSVLYGDASGINGAEGAQRATQAFQAGPGYQWAMDQGMQALNRRRAAGGMLNSGNADTDAIQFGQGLANQRWDQWLANLGQLDQRGLATAGARAGMTTRLGDLGMGHYGQRAGIMDENVRDIVGLGVGAFKAGDQAKAANEQMRMGAINLGMQILGNGIAGGGGGGGGGGGFAALSKLFGG